MVSYRRSVSAWPGASNAERFIVKQFLPQYQALPPHYLSLSTNRKSGVFDTLRSKHKLRISRPSNTLPDLALTGSAMPAYEIASLLLPIEDFAIVLRAINGPFNQLELPDVVSVPFIDSIPGAGRV